MLIDLPSDSPSSWIDSPSGWNKRMLESDWNNRTLEAIGGNKDHQLKVALLNIEDRGIVFFICSSSFCFLCNIKGKCLNNNYTYVNEHTVYKAVIHDSNKIK